MATAIEKLQPSRISNQLELVGNDPDLDSLKLQMRGLSSRPISDVLLSAEAERTIDGASTITIVCDDYDRSILNSKMLKAKTDINIDGLWFRLVKVRKSGDQITLVFEDREVAVLRTYNKKVTRKWGVTTRCKFARGLVSEVKELKLKFICEADLAKKPKAKPKPKGRELASVQESQDDRSSGGFPDGKTFKVKGQIANAQQRQNADTILRVGTTHGPIPRKLLVVSMMVAIQESSITNLDYPLPGAYNYLGPRKLNNPVGVFQQRRSMGWAATRNVAVDAADFFDHVQVQHRSHPSASFFQLAEDTQHSGNGQAYAQWRTEAERIVTLWGVTGGPASSEADPLDIPAGDMFTDGDSQVDYQFTRGFPQQKPDGTKGWKKENTWDCLGRLADEVNWRRFCVSGTIYMLSETTLFKSTPRMTISEASQGIDVIDGDIDEGKTTGTISIKCRLDRWSAPPGSVVSIVDSGVLNGRWLINSIKRSLFRSDATISCTKPRPKLPEPTKPVDQAFEPPLSPEPFTDVDSTLLYFPFPSGTKWKSGGGPAEHAKRAYGNWYSDNAWDIMADGGTTILAVESGTIGPVTRRPPGKASGRKGTTYGATTFLRGNSGRNWCYMHQNLQPQWVKQGVKVNAGQVIGSIAHGTPGGDHLHIGVDTGDPVALLKEAKHISASGLPPSSQPHGR